MNILIDAPFVAVGFSSLFIYKRVYKAVLINYPSEKQKEKLYDYQNYI